MSSSNASIVDRPSGSSVLDMIGRTPLVRLHQFERETPGVEIRIKHKTSAPMHLKTYQIDGRLLRTGAANFSASGGRVARAGRLARPE